jgi:hypothetical protein
MNDIYETVRRFLELLDESSLEISGQISPKTLEPSDEILEAEELLSELRTLIDEYESDHVEE